MFYFKIFLCSFFTTFIFFVIVFFFDLFFYFRNKAPGLDTYMTVVYKGGSFHRVILTVNPSKLDPVWDVAPSYAQVDASGIDTLEVKF